MQGIEAVVEGNFTKGLRVLIVEDDPVSLKILESLMCNCKYHPTMVMDALMELKMPKKGKNELDRVISNMHMPDMEGFMLLQLIRVEPDLRSISRLSA
ncbi:hypothetical protein CFC21_111342 [Triticum aestivum]|uniref:Response regulatory domain-containing protein n=3 Tax=Triticinae TaxID=1648030 RepID=A0A3B6TR20_WHEAT|nr:hypothetical protein CFC21_111342 [Triticum aestivum]